MLNVYQGLFEKKSLRFVFPLDFRDHSDWNVNSKFILCLYQVRPKLPLLKILQAAGAQGEMFTVKEVSWDSPSGPGVKTLASGAEGVGSVPGHILFWGRELFKILSI